MAFFVMLWQSETENSVLFALFPLTWMNASRARYCFQGSAFTPSNSSSNVRASNVPTSASTRSAVRSQRHARAMAEKSPGKVTRASATLSGSIPMRRSSAATSDSSPNLQVAINLMLCPSVSSIWKGRC